jgi:hypothetical protein
MPTHRGSTQHRAAAGWFPDPLGPPKQLRWWDGAAWSASVRTPADQVATLERSRQPRRKRRVIGWAAIGAFALGVSGVVIAVRRGQDVCEVSATGITFCEDDDDTRREVEQAQPAIEQQASALESEAQAQAAADPATDAADLSGTWTGDDGFTYLIEQFGNQATITETLAGMTYGVGSGTVTGPLFTFAFNAVNGSFGTGSLELAGETLTGSFDNLTTGFSSPAVLRR